MKYELQSGTLPPAQAAKIVDSAHSHCNNRSKKLRVVSPRFDLAVACIDM